MSLTSLVPGLLGWEILASKSNGEILTQHPFPARSPRTEERRGECLNREGAGGEVRRQGDCRGRGDTWKCYLCCARIEASCMMGEFLGSGDS